MDLARDGRRTVALASSSTGGKVWVPGALGSAGVQVALAVLVTVCPGATLAASVQVTSTKAVSVPGVPAASSTMPLGLPARINVRPGAANRVPLVVSAVPPASWVLDTVQPVRPAGIGSLTTTP